MLLISLASVCFAIYFGLKSSKRNEKVDINQAQNIVNITPDNFFLLPYEGGQSRYTYVVTALDAFGNESKERKIKVKL